MPELTPADIVSALQSRGWEASIVSSDDVSHMVPTKSTGILKCVDGRGEFAGCPTSCLVIYLQVEQIEFHTSDSDVEMLDTSLNNFDLQVACQLTYLCC